MHYDLTLPIKDLAGVQVTDEIDKDGYTLGSVLVRSALWLDKSRLLTPLEKQAAFQLAKRLALAGGSIELSIEDVAFLKAQAGAMWSTLVMGQVWELLERPLVPPAKPVAGIPAEPATE